MEDPISERFPRRLGLLVSLLFLREPLRPLDADLLLRPLEFDLLLRPLEFDLLLFLLELLLFLDISLLILLGTSSAFPVNAEAWETEGLLLIVSGILQVMRHPMQTMIVFW